MSLAASHRPSLHAPVMLKEMLAAVAPREGDVVVDGTFGAGGYSRALLGAAKCRVIAFDRDPEVKLLADALAREFAPGHFFFIAARFSAMVEMLAQHGVHAVDAIVLDIGVSSMQLDQAARGFSFSKDGPLDMRMARGGQSAADIVNTADVGELTRILREYGEEKQAVRIAKAIVAARALQPITTTKQLADIVASVVRAHKGMNPATRTFQALRMEVNQELAELESALAAAEQLLKPGGRLVVVTFHSLEDRKVKQFLQNRCSAAQAVSRHSPAAFTPAAPQQNTFQWSPKHPITPTQEEVSVNPRSRSAKLRCATRTALPAH